MKKHLPSLHESLELLALTLMIVGLQWALHSWGWSVLFAVGFIWNWAVLNGWVLQRTQERRYRFSVLRGITMFHQAILFPFKKFPRIQTVMAVLPAGLAFAALAYAFEANIPWWAAVLGSFAFLLTRRQIRSIRLS